MYFSVAIYVRFSTSPVSSGAERRDSVKSPFREVRMNEQLGSANSYNRLTITMVFRLYERTSSHPGELPSRYDGGIELVI